MKNLYNQNNEVSTPALYWKHLFFLILLSTGYLFSSTVFSQTYRSSSQGWAAYDDKTLDVPKPGSLQVGDVMIAGISVRPWDVNIVNVPTGWVFVRSNSAGSTGDGGDNQQAIYYKIVTAADLLPTTLNYQWKFNQSEGSVGGIITFSGVENSYNPIDKHAGAPSGSGLTFSSPSVNTTYPNEVVIGFHSYGSSGTWTNPVGATFPMTQRVDIASRTVPNVLGVSMEISHGVKATAGATGAVAATASNDDEVGVSQIVALMPNTSITYGGGTPYCKNGGTATVTRTGLIGGQYSSTPGLSISTTTGTINLGASNVGTYTVTYRYGTTLQYSTTAPITINPLPTATISGTASICEDAASPNITFTGAAGTPPYTFTYKVNGGANQTVTTTSGSSVTVSQPTTTAGTFTYTLVSVSDASCSQTQSGTATITVKPAPTAMISGTATVCKNATAASVTFTGATATAPYTFTYKINGGANQTVTTTSGSSVTVSQPTTTTGTFTYTLVSVASANSCSQLQSGSAVITVTALPTATISGNATICQNGTSPNITFTGAGGIAPYTFTYKINGGANQTVTTTSGSSVTVSQPTATTGTFTYTLVSVSSASCSQVQSGTAAITVTSLPTATISGTTTICQNATAPNILFTGAGGPVPYTFTYKINGGANQTVTTTSGSSVTVSQPTTTAGTFTYTLVSVSSASCSQNQSGTTTITVRPLPTATISGNSTVCQNAAASNILFTGAGGTAPYAFTYKVNGGANQTVTTTSGSSVTVSQPTATTGTFTYTLVSVSSAASCSQTQSGTAAITVLGAVGSPTFSSGSTSNRCQATETITYAASATNATGITYSLDGASISAGNTINTSTGQVTFLVGWTGTSIITATAAGCNGPRTSTHTVSTVAAPSANFAYTANPYCTNGGNASVSFSGTTGGTFSSTAGLSIDAATGYVNVQASTPGAYTVNYTIASTGNCPAYIVTTPININVHAIWNGSVSRNWHDANNWSCGGVPTLTSNAVIPSGLSRYPIIYSGIGTTRNLTIEAGATIDDLGALTIAGQIYNSGVINALAGKVELAWTTAQTIPTSLFYLKTIQDLVISNPAGVSLKGPLRVTGSLAFGNVNNTVFKTGDSLTLASVATSDAQLKDITNGGLNSGNAINGAVIVERYIPAKRAYRFLTAPVNSTGSIKANWMENSINPDRWNRINPYPGYGTNITGAGDGANGFDATQTRNPSMFSFNNVTQAWVPIPNTNGIMSAGTGYMIIVRGDRNIDMNTNTPPPTPTTLRAKGTVMTGNVNLAKAGAGGTPGIGSLSANSGAFNLVANPYPSAINWLTADKTDIAGTIYIFDPTISGSHGRGGYVSFNVAIGANSNNASKADNFIQSGQAFFVQTTGPNPFIRFKETDKTASHRKVFRGANLDPNIGVQLLLPSQQGSNESADGSKVYFSDDYNNAIGDEDSYKFTNQDENIAIMNKGTALSLEGRKPVTGSDSLLLKVWQLTQNNYLLKVNFNNFSYNVEAYLKDKYLSTITQLNTSGETIVPVSITADAASKAPDRYKIVFESFATLPLHLLGIKAVEKSNGVEVGWTAESESNMDRYEVEKSSDGQHFVTAGTVKAKINPGPSSFYTWFDLVTDKGDNYYRIKSVDKAGAIKYSSIAKVRLENGASGISVFPNPVHGKMITLRFTDIKKGNYNVSLFNTSGEKVYNGTIFHNRGSADHRIELKSFLSPGAYHLQVSDNDDKETILLIIQ